MKKEINTQSAPAPVGPYSQAIEYGNTVFISGQIPINPSTKEVEKKDIKGQTIQVLENIKAILNELGLDFSNVLKAEIFLIDMNDFAIVNQIYAQYFSVEPQPARQAVEVARLPLDVMVEISCIVGK